MKMTCIIPTRDRRDMVLQAIRSVMGQEGKVSEVIVVDDGSLDGTTEAVRTRYPEVKLVSTPGLGPGAARNRGVAESTGEVLMFLDSDDRWLSSHSDALMGLMREGYEVAYGVTQTMDSLGGDVFLVPDNGQGPSGSCFSALVRWCFLVPSSVCMSRKAFHAAGGFGPGSLAEDWAFFLRLAAEFPFGFTPQVISRRLLHEGSLCCIRGEYGQILEALSRVMAVVETAAASGPEDLAWVRSVRDLALTEGWKWRTVQEWYTSMKMRGMLESLLSLCPSIGG
jgi:glycosyltransferase involved in cell wall biosynthesis